MSAIAPSRINHRRPRRRARMGIFEQLRRLDDDPILWCGCTSTAIVAECHEEHAARTPAMPSLAPVPVLQEAAA